MMRKEKTPKWHLERRLEALVREHGKKWKEIARVVNAEGLLNKQNKPFSAMALRQRWNRIEVLRARFFRHTGTDWTMEDLTWLFPKEDADFLRAMAQVLMVGTYLETTGKLLRSLALHHAEGPFDELGLSLLGNTCGWTKFPERSREMDASTALMNILLQILTQLEKMPDIDQQWLKRERLRESIVSPGVGVGTFVLKRAHSIERRRRGLAGENDNPELPPKPIRSRKNGNRAKTRRNIGGTIDSVLKELFEHQRKSIGISAGGLLDTILWHWYGWPVLSYENPSEIENGGILIVDESHDHFDPVALCLIPFFEPRLPADQIKRLLLLMNCSEKEIDEVLHSPRFAKEGQAENNG